MTGSSTANAERLRFISTSWASPTPEEGPRLGYTLKFEIPGDGADCINGFSVGGIARKHDIEVGKVALFEPSVEIGYFFCRCPGALELLVTGVIT